MNSSLSATELKMAIAVATLTTVPLLALAVLTPAQGAQDAVTMFSSNKAAEDVFSFVSGGSVIAQSTDTEATTDTGTDLSASPEPTVSAPTATDSSGDSATGGSVTQSQDHHSMDIQTSGDNVEVTADEDDISISIDHTGTLDGSSNESEVEIDRTVDTRERNSHSVDNDIDEDIDAGNDKIKNNEFVGTINPGTVRVDFDGLDD